MDDKTRKGILIAVGITALVALLLWGLVSKIQSSLKEGAQNIASEINKEIEEEEAAIAAGAEPGEGMDAVRAISKQLVHLQRVKKLAAEIPCEELPAKIEAYVMDHRDELLEAKRATESSKGKMRKKHGLKIAMLAANLATESFKLLTAVESRCPQQNDRVAELVSMIIDPDNIPEQAEAKEEMGEE